MLQAAAAKLEGPCVSYYYVEEREAAMTTEPYTYVWNEASAVAAVEIELEGRSRPKIIIIIIMAGLA